jgi:DNA-binding SARP family transcriptional activator
MRTLHQLLRVSIAAVLVGAIALLVASRPALPTAAASSSARHADAVLIFIAWFGGLLLALGLLYRIATRTIATPPSRAPIRHLHPDTAAKRPIAAAYSDRAFPLILTRPHAPLEDLPAEPPPDPARASPAPDTDASRQRAETGAAISLLGPLTISGGRRHIRRLRGPTKELLAYLALHPSGAHRDQIIDALWPDQSPDQGRNRLWRAAADARTHFGDAAVLRDGNHYQLDRTQISIDVDQLEQLLAKLEHVERTDDELTVLERALALFNSEPLVGSDFPWAENEQRRLHGLRLDLLERAGHARLALGDPAGALAVAEVGLTLEPYNERLARLAMEAEAAIGLRSAVINRYEQLSQLLDEQLGLQPHQETRSLYRHLLGQDVRAPT